MVITCKSRRAVQVVIICMCRLPMISQFKAVEFSSASFSYENTLHQHFVDSNQNNLESISVVQYCFYRQ